MDTLPESVYFILAGQDVASAWLWRPWGLYLAFCSSLLMRFSWASLSSLTKIIFWLRTFVFLVSPLSKLKLLQNSLLHFSVWCFSFIKGTWAAVYFITFCYVANHWQRSDATEDQLKQVNVNNIRASIAFAFFSIFSWVRFCFVFQLLCGCVYQYFSPTLKMHPY